MTCLPKQNENFDFESLYRKPQKQIILIDRIKYKFCSIEQTNYDSPNYRSKVLIFFNVEFPH